MKKFLPLLILLTAPLFSALAPLPQSIREIEAILMNPQLAQSLPSGDQIDQITRVVDGYLIITKAHILKVTVVYDASGRIGPKKFTLQFSEAKPIKL